MAREINKSLLRKIRNKILKFPESYRQGIWGRAVSKSNNTPCGARACIAGHALLISEFCTPQELALERKGYEGFEPFEIGAKLLGLSDREAMILFDGAGEDWPEPFEERFRRARRNADKARVAADYINYIIRTGKVT